MLVATTTAIAMRCPGCGKIQYHALSLFSFSIQKSFRFTCDCGAPLLLVSTKDRKIFYLQFDCLMCDEKHFVKHRLKEIWSSRVTSLVCEETGLDVGFIGPREQVKKCIASQERSLREIAEDLGFADYFTDPEVMYEILDCLHKIAEDGKLSCQCKNLQIEVEIFSDRVELRCSNCGAIGVIGAESREEIETLKNVWEIRLKTGKVQMIGIGKSGGKRKRFKK